MGGGLMEAYKIKAQGKNGWWHDATTYDGNGRRYDA